MFEILVIVSAVFVWVAYHKIFHVVYFDFGRSLIKEAIISLFGGAVVAYLIMNYWFIAIPIIAIAGYGLIKKK